MRDGKGRHGKRRNAIGGKASRGRARGGRARAVSNNRRSAASTPTLIKAMKAILGYTPVKWPEPDDLTVGGHALEGPEDRLLPVRCQGAVAF